MTWSGAKGELSGRMGRIRLRRVGGRIRRWFDFNLENTILLILVVVLVLLCAMYGFGFLFFQLDGNVVPVLGTIVQSLASIFAIVFSISLVAIQLCSENLSHRLILLFVRSSNFLFPFGLNLVALLFNLVLLSYGCYHRLAGHGIILCVAAVLSLILFFVYTVRFLTPLHVVRVLLAKVNVDRMLLENFGEEQLYRRYFQPIEDIISSCAVKGDYATARSLIDLVRFKMQSVLNVLNKRMRMESHEMFVRSVVFMSRPFARLLEGVSVSSNKKDAMEVTYYVIWIIGDFVEKFRDARLAYGFRIFDESIERILSQARFRFRADEYAADLARLEVAVARARASFSTFTE